MVNAEYDEYDEAFVVKTRTLGKYVISDVELTIVNTVPEVENNNQGQTGGNVIKNPGTGAAV